MFLSRRRDVVYPQAEHQRLSGVIAAAWAEPPPLPFALLVRGVATHDRGYGELDTDEIGGVSDERWLEIQRRGVAAQDDSVVDLLVAMHVARLASYGDDAAARRELEAVRDERLAAAGVETAVATAADRITELCDRVTFAFCFEQAGSGEVGSIAYVLDADGAGTLDPWPLRGPELRETATGFEAGGYPERLVPVERELRLSPAAL